MKRRAVVIVAAVLVLCAATAAASAFFAPAPVTSAGSVSTGTLAAPSGLSATGGNSITLNWTATTSTYATGTRVLRGTTSDGPYSQIALVSPRTTTTYVDSPAAGTYFYVVEAYYQQWTSTDSAQASAARAAVAFVQTAHAGGSTTDTANFATTPVAGDLLVAIAGTRNAGTITGPVGWSVAIDSGSSNAPHEAIYYKIAGALEPKSVTIVTTASGTGNGLAIFEYSGVTTLLGSGTASGSGTAVGAGPVTISSSYSLVVTGLLADSGTGFSGWTNGFAEVSDFVAGSGGAKTLFGSGGVLATAPGTYATVATSTASGTWLGQIVAFG